MERDCPTPMQDGAVGRMVGTKEVRLIPGVGDALGQISTVGNVS